MIRRVQRQQVDTTDVGDNHYVPASSSTITKTRQSSKLPFFQYILTAFFFGAAYKLIENLDFVVSTLRGACPVGSPEAFSKCSLKRGTECPFDCINMPLYNRQGQCTKEIDCRPIRHCTCEATRGGEWFCTGGEVAIDDSCKEKNPDTYESCVCPRP
jgi:hypothetical protein